MGVAGPKQLLAWEGEPLVRRVVRRALASRCRRVHVVVGSRAEAVRAALAGLSVDVVTCADWEEGLAASLRAGVRAAAAAAPPVDAILLVLADQPAVDTPHLDALLDRVEAGAPIAASAYGGTLGAPAAFSRAHVPELLELAGDRGARSLLERHAARVARIPCPEAAADVDEPGDAPPA